MTLQTHFDFVGMIGSGNGHEIFVKSTKRTQFGRTGRRGGGDIINDRNHFPDGAFFILASHISLLRPP